MSLSSASRAKVASGLPGGSSILRQIPSGKFRLKLAQVRPAPQGQGRTVTISFVHVRGFPPVPSS